MKWLDRQVSASGPLMRLCLSEADYLAAMKHCGITVFDQFVSDGSHATTHIGSSNKGDSIAIVCLDAKNCEGRDPLEVVGLLVHEAVHVWQEYCLSIGEKCPGAEQEAYAVQHISQALLGAYRDTLAAREKG